MDLNTVIKGPLITEKLDKARETQRQYSFLVDRKATKHDVSRAVASQFKVTVLDVRTLIMRGKIKRVGQSMGKRSNFKKAFVTLKEGDKIELFEGFSNSIRVFMLSFPFGAHQPDLQGPLHFLP